MCRLTSWGTWMKAKAYSVACAGSTRVLKAGGRAPRRLDGRISLCRGHVRPRTLHPQRPLLSQDSSGAWASESSNSRPHTTTRFHLAPCTGLSSQ